MPSDRLDARMREAVAALHDTPVPALSAAPIDKGETNPLVAVALRLCGLKNDTVALTALGRVGARI